MLAADRATVSLAINAFGDLKRLNYSRGYNLNTLCTVKMTKSYLLARWSPRAPVVPMASLGAEVPGQHQSLASRPRSERFSEIFQ